MSAQPLQLPGDALAILRRPEHSSHREQLIEYTVLSELLQDGWLRRAQAVDVLRSDVDAAGYDLALQCQGVLRHVQLKSSLADGSAQKQKVHVALANQRSGCVVWVVLSPGTQHRVALEYLVFGGAPGEPLRGLAEYKNAIHTKANAQGFKAVRPSIREVPRSAFTRLKTTAQLSDWLFGAP